VTFRPFIAQLFLGGESFGRLEKRTFLSDIEEAEDKKATMTSARWYLNVQVFPNKVIHLFKASQTSITGNKYRTPSCRVSSTFCRNKFDSSLNSNQTETWNEFFDDGFLPSCYASKTAFYLWLVRSFERFSCKSKNKKTKKINAATMTRLKSVGHW
jgi:hypothetical protein